VDTLANIDATTARLRRTVQFQLLPCAVAVIAVSALLTGIASADEQRGAAFQVPRENLASAEALANRLAALSPTVNHDEANRLAQCAYATVCQLRRQYRMFGTPIFNNFLVFHGIKKRGYCYQWAEDLLLALDSLKLTTMELHWAEAHAGNWRENNCVVLTAKGQPFDRGIMLESWKHFGHLRWGPIAGDIDPYVENAAYAHFIRARAASKASAGNHQVALQTQTKAKEKTK
jgi:hypothetical protein